MSMVGKFLQDPLGFFSANIVMVTYSVNRNQPQIYPFTIKKGYFSGFDLNYTGVRNANPIPIYTITAPCTDDRTFDAYWCPYADNGLQSITISNGADFVFTAKMDGCSFGVSSAAPDGSQRVTHANLKNRGIELFQNQGDSGGQGREQAMVLKRVEGINDPGYRILGPANYRPVGNAISTTFGVRSKGNRWSFYGQALQVDPILKVIEYLALVEFG